MQQREFKDRRTNWRNSVMSSGYFFCLCKYKYGLVQIRNISVKGMGLLAEEELASAFQLEIWMSIPSKDEFLHVYGDVAWSKKVEPNKYRVGLKFKNDIPEGISQILLNFS